MIAKTTFAIKSWDEKPYDEFDGGRKMTQAHVNFTYTGDLIAESKVEYVMTYAADGTAAWVGMERIIGTLAGKAGSFVIQHVGTYNGTTTDDTWTIINGSGTGELEGIHGNGKASTTSGEDAYSFTLTYDFKKA